MPNLLDLINKYYPAYTGPGGSKVYQSAAPAKAVEQAKAEQSIFPSANNVVPAVVTPPAKTIFTPQTNNAPVQQTPPAPSARSKYINPANGKYFTPEEYANYVATKIPVSSDVPEYAGDAMTNPNASAEDLTKTARNLNNARNDMAVGATDPYKVGNQSGIAYSPQELKAIEKAYAGIYDPALNDVFARLETKKKEDEAKARREEQIFATNENIRQWKATTGTKGSGNDVKDLFSQTQLNNGARNAGMTIEGFSKLDEDLINFFVAPPNDTDEITGKSYPMNKTFENLVKLATSGEMKIKDAADEIEGSNLPETVKHYYLDQLPLTDVEKQGYFSKLWGAITGK